MSAERLQVRGEEVRDKKMTAGGQSFFCCYKLGDYFIAAVMDWAMAAISSAGSVSF